MKLTKTEIESLYEINIHPFNDLRGGFLKTFSNEYFKTKFNINLNIKEIYYSTSKKNVLRGVHLQKNESKNYKLIHCVKGKILDVCIDLRKKSKTFMKIHSTHLNEKSNKVLFVPPGVGHAFLSSLDNSIILYASNKNYSKKNDISIRWNSINYNWKIKKPILSIIDSKAMLLFDYLGK